MSEPTHVTAVDLGGSKILAGLVDRAGRVASRLERPTPRGSTDDVLAAVDAVVEQLGEAAAIGIGIPGTVDDRTGRVITAANLPLHETDVAGHFSRRFGLPVVVENDANAAAVAEWRLGAGRGTRDMVMLTLGTGVGGGLILDGRLYRGALGAAGELGHVVLDHDGPGCHGGCSGRGHVEALTSGAAADRSARELLGPKADARELVRQARDGDEAAREALAAIGSRLGSAIGSLVNILDPEVVVVGGGFAGAGDLVLEPAREVAVREALEPARGLVRIVPAELGGDAGLIGAALCAFDALAQAAA